jgi:hypothetical protein
MEAEKQHDRQARRQEPIDPQQKTTDPQQNEIDGNVFGSAFEDIAGDTKGRQDEVDKPSASQTGGVQEENDTVD